MSLEVDSCAIGALHRRATKDVKLQRNSRRDGSFKFKNDFAFKGPKKRKKKHKCERGITSVVFNSSRQKYKGKKLRPEAPFNSTQFIMEEHDNLSDKDLSAVTHRHGESLSQSDDPEEGSAEDEFLAKDFWSAYQDVHAETLDTMPKYQLVQELLSLEEKISALERELDSAQKQDRERIREPSPAGEDEETNPGEVPVDAETAAKIEIFTSEIRKLECENKKLQEEKLSLRRSATCLRCGFPSHSRSISSSDSSDEEPSDRVKSTAAVSTNLKYVNLESNTDSGLASLEGNTSSSSEELREEPRYYLCDKSAKGFVSSTTL